MFEADLAAAARRSSARAAAGAWTASRDLGARGRLGRGDGARPPRRAQRARRPAHPRPLRQPHRPGRARPVLALAAARRRRARDHSLPWRDPQPGRARRARRRCSALVAGRLRRHVPDLDDLRRRPGAAQEPGAGRRVGAAPDAARLRARRALRHGDDREAGRLRRARQHHARRAAGRRHLRDHRPQVVLLLPPVRRLPDARPGARRPVVLPGRGPRPAASGSSA